MSADDEKTFTGQRLDWCKAVRFDRGLQAVDFKVGSTIADHVNAKTGVAKVSDAIIAIKAACSIRTAIRARERLRDRGWLDWRRTPTANRYLLRYDKVSGFLDMITAAVEAHREAEERRPDQKRRPSVLPPMTEHGAPCSVTPDSPVLSLVAEIHPIRTPSEKRVGKK